MPFTLSHAAAALPLRHLLRGAAVFPALVIGCFIPDIPYFLPDPIYAINAHQLPGLVLFGIPCGWAIYALWFGVFLQPSLALLPRRCARLLAESQAKRHWAAPWCSITLSLMAGAATHVVWDAFTHRRGVVVQAWPELAQPVVHAAGYALPTYVVLQHVSTVIGLAWLGLHVRRRLREVAREAPVPDAAPEWSLERRLLVIAALTVAAAALAWSELSPHAATPLRFSAYNVVCRSISSAAVVAAVYALGWHALDRARRAKSG